MLPSSPLSDRRAVIRLLVCYDVCTLTREGRKRLRRIAEICGTHGYRVQLSVFEVSVSPQGWDRLRRSLATAMDPEEDTVRIYRLYGERSRRLEILGRDMSAETYLGLYGTQGPQQPGFDWDDG